MFESCRPSLPSLVESSTVVLAGAIGKNEDVLARPYSRPFGADFCVCFHVIEVLQIALKGERSFEFARLLR